MRRGVVLQAFKLSLEVQVKGTNWLRMNPLVFETDHFQIFTNQSQKSREADRSRQDSNLRGETPMDFSVHRLNHSATTTTVMYKNNFL